MYDVLYTEEHYRQTRYGFSVRECFADGVIFQTI